MIIHTCRRCEGCGYVTGGYNWEVAWVRLASRDNVDAERGVFAPHVCPDCGGTGALLELPVAARAPLPTRYGLRSEHPYADHVKVILQAQALRALTN